MTYVGLTKGELVAQLADVPDDAPVYVPYDTGCFGLAKVESVWCCGDDDEARHTGIPKGYLLIEADLDGAQEIPATEEDGPIPFAEYDDSEGA